MPSERIAVLVPGILGSALEDKSGGQIWSDDFHINYKTLLSNPGLLSWNGVKAKAQLLKNVRLGPCSVPLWDAIYKQINFPGDFGIPRRIVDFGYDWRQPNADSASDLSDFLSNLIGLPLKDPPPPEEKRRLTFIMHSMGGLVVRMAIAINSIDLGWFDRLIHVGSPLFGSQSAFRILFGAGDGLPLLSTLLSVRHLRNRQRFVDILQQSIRTCPAIYELLPREQIPYLYYSATRRSNPLSETHLAAHLRTGVIQAHAHLDRANTLLKHANIASFTIYTPFLQSLRTDIDYRVEVQPPHYRILEIVGSTLYGDGTVLPESARGDPAIDQSIPVYGCSHADMCRNHKVAAILQSIL